MGRELKRVPLDFSWSIDKVWSGYLNPHYKKCPDCENGSTAARERLSDLVSLLMLSGSDSLGGKNHPYFDSMQQFIYGFNSIPSKDMIELTEGLAGRKIDRIGHDASDRWRATAKIIKAAGLPKKWGTCKTCKGESIDPAVKRKYNSWKQSDPPKGDGYQLWTTTNEGAPISPVFSTLESLCEYAQDNCSTFGYNKTSKKNWMEMLDDGFVVHQEGNMLFI